MNGSITIVPSEQQQFETWRRYYNGPHAGLIDVALAKTECPWLVGSGAGVTISCSQDGTGFHFDRH